MYSSQDKGARLLDRGGQLGTYPPQYGKRFILTFFLKGINSVGLNTLVMRKIKH